MKICFINSNLRPTFVFGRVAYEVPTTGRLAQAMVNICHSKTREFSQDMTPAEISDAAEAIEFLVQHSCAVGNLHELEHNGSHIIHVFNKAKHLPKRLAINL